MYVALVIRPCPGTVWSSYTHKTTCNKVDGVIRFSIYQIVLWQFLQVLNSLFQTCQQCGRSSAIHTFLTACLLICYTSCEIFACAVGSHFRHNVKPYSTLCISSVWPLRKIYHELPIQNGVECTWIRLVWVYIFTAPIGPFSLRSIFGTVRIKQAPVPFLFVLRLPIDTVQVLYGENWYGCLLYPCRAKN